ncbi:MAG: glucose-6-phosphate dehydrogenase assembly protein OpcA [Mycobacteriales bacterium]
MTTLWDTTGTEVVKALAAERRLAGSVSSGMALTLVVVVDEKHVGEAEQAATRAAAQHPCRLLVVVRRRPDAPEPRLDAEVLIGGRLGPGEAVVMRMYGRLALHAESVVLPLLAPDAPVVTWWYGDPPYLIAHDPLGVVAGRRITDATGAADPVGALHRRAEDYAPGDTDLAWTRTTLWRSLCASAFDSLSGPVAAVSVSGEASNPSRALLAGWLGGRLGVTVELHDTDGPGVTGVELRLDDTTVTISRTDGRTATLSRAGQPDRAMPLPRRELGDLLAEELRRLDADETYAEALETCTGVTGLSGRPATRTHVWQDPADDPDLDPALTTS